MPSTRTARVLVVLGLLCGLSGPSAAERAALFVGGNGKGLDRPALINIARAQAEAAGWSVTEPPLGDSQLNDLIDCVSTGMGQDCIPGYLDDNDVDRGIVISIQQEGTKGKTTWVVNGWVFRRTGDLLITDRRYCDGCKPEQLAETVRDLADTLVREARDRAKPTMFVARSRPAGAKVFVNDKAVGVAPLEAPVYAGVYTVRFELDGHRNEIREVAIGDGESVTVEVTLKADAVQPPEKPVDTKPPSRLVPLSLIGGGAVALLVGGIVLAMDEDAVQDGVQVPQYTDTKLPAVGLFAVGAAAAGAGAYLLISSRSDRNGTGLEKTPVVGLAPGGAWLGVAGRF